MTAAAPEAVEHALLLRVLGTLIREDVLGLRTRSTLEHRDDGSWLRLPTGDDGAAVMLPVQEDGFQSEFAARAPILRIETNGRALSSPDQTSSQPSPQPTGYDDLTSPGPTDPAPTSPDPASPQPAVAKPAITKPAAHHDLTDAEQILTHLAHLAQPEDATGFAAFTAEYHDALTALRLSAATRDEVTTRLATRHGTDCARWHGPRTEPAFDTLAAHAGHPLYPTGAARPGVAPEDLPRYAPEFAPSFALRWLAVPSDTLTTSGDFDPERLLGGDWPQPGDLGLAELDATHTALPVHPLTAAGHLPEALRAAGLDTRAVLAEHPFLDVVPTLSMRTVALTDHPGTHLKLPLATSTLGRLNRRTIKPGTLADGALMQQLLERIAAREPRLRGHILHADETRYAHAGHELLAVLVRRQPAGLDDCTVLPLAALAATAPGGRLVLDHLADRYFGGDPFSLLDAVLSLLLDWQTTLLGYGIALESHQQNISLVLDEPPGRRARVRLLFKDDDGPRIHHARLRAALGADAPDKGEFADQRMLVTDDRLLLEVFTTITVHLCAGAFAYGLARRGWKDRLLDLVGGRLDQAARRLGEAPGEPGAALRAHVLDAPRLPVKAMVTAGTLLTKERSGACDINKHYTTGPNYLARGRR